MTRPLLTQSASASEFVRGHLSSGGFCDPRTGKTHSVSDVSYVVTGCLDNNQTEGMVDGRLLKHFNILHWDGYRYACRMHACACTTVEMYVHD